MPFPMKLYSEFVEYKNSGEAFITEFSGSEEYKPYFKQAIAYMKKHTCFAFKGWEDTRINDRIIVAWGVFADFLRGLNMFDSSA